MANENDIADAINRATAEKIVSQKIYVPREETTTSTETTGEGDSATKSTITKTKTVYDEVTIKELLQSGSYADIVDQAAKEYKNNKNVDTPFTRSVTAFMGLKALSQLAKTGHAGDYLEPDEVLFNNNDDITVLGDGFLPDVTVSGTGEIATKGEKKVNAIECRVSKKRSSNYFSYSGVTGSVIKMKSSGGSDSSEDIFFEYHYKYENTGPEHVTYYKIHFPKQLAIGTVMTLDISLSYISHPRIMVVERRPASANGLANPLTVIRDRYAYTSSDVNKKNNKTTDSDRYYEAFTDKPEGANSFINLSLGKVTYQLGYIVNDIDRERFNSQQYPSYTYIWPNSVDRTLLNCDTKLLLAPGNAIFAPDSLIFDYGASNIVAIYLTFQNICENELYEGAPSYVMKNGQRDLLEIVASAYGADLIDFYKVFYSTSNGLENAIELVKNRMKPSLSADALKKVDDAQNIDDKCYILLSEAMNDKPDLAYGCFMAYYLDDAQINSLIHLRIAANKYAIPAKAEYTYSTDSGIIKNITTYDVVSEDSANHFNPDYIFYIA